MESLPSADQTVVDNYTFRDSSGDDSYVACGTCLHRKNKEKDSSLNKSTTPVGQWSVQQNIALAPLSPEPYLNSMSHDFPQSSKTASKVSERIISAPLQLLDFDDSGFEDLLWRIQATNMDDDSSLMSLTKTQDETKDILKNMLDTVPSLTQKMAEEKTSMQQNSNKTKIIELENELKEARDELKEAHRTIYQLSRAVGTGEEMKEKLDELVKLDLKRNMKMETLLTKLRKQEEENAELKKNLKGTVTELSLLQHKITLLQRTSEAIEDTVRSNAPNVEGLENRLQEMFNKESSELRDSENKIQKIDNLVETVNSLEQKIDEIKTRSENSTNSRDDMVIELLNSLRQDQDSIKETLGIWKTTRVVTEKDKEMEDWLKAVLTGKLSWMRSRVFLRDGRIQTEAGETFGKTEFSDTVSHRPWIIVPGDYEVDCCNSKCKRTMCVKENLREDKVSVMCAYCQYDTILGPAPKGCKWVKSYPCHHYHAVAVGHKLKNCGSCGIKADIDDRGNGWERIVRAPRR